MLAGIGELEHLLVQLLAPEMECQVEVCWIFLDCRFALAFATSNKPQHVHRKLALFNLF